MYFDTHVHLNSEQYENFAQIIINALKNNVSKMVVIGYDLESSKKAIEIANSCSFVYAAVGIHPSEIKKMNNDDLKQIEKLLSNPKVVAIGEIGLDYHWDKDNKQEQQEMFIKQLKLAKKHKLPIIVHSRDAGNDTLEILKNNKKLYKTGIMHCYSYSLDLAQEYLKLNLYLAFGGALTFLNAKQNKEVVKEVELEKLLIETDAPYLTPHPYRGERNEPKYISLVAKEMAKIKNIEEEMVADITYRNACKVFGIKK